MRRRRTVAPKPVPVYIKVPDIMAGGHLAYLMGPCKEHDGGFECYIVDQDVKTKSVCVNPNNGKDVLRRLDNTSGGR